MRVHIISDMEGVSGINKWEQVVAGQSMYEEGRKLYTGEINAAVRGAKAAGATEIVVMDCHGAGGDHSFNSLIPEDLDPGCEYVVQSSWTEYAEFLESGCDAALLVGMHAMAGSERGGMSHTVSGSEWHNLWFNGTLVGETGVNAALCGTWKTPAAGHRRRCGVRRGTGLAGQRSPDRTGQVKKALSRFSARNMPPRQAREMIEDGAKQALKDFTAVKPYDPGHPCEIKVEYQHSDGADKVRKKPGVEILGPRTIVSRADDWWTAWRQFFLV